MLAYILISNPMMPVMLDECTFLISPGILDCRKEQCSHFALLLFVARQTAGCLDDITGAHADTIFDFHASVKEALQRRRLNSQRFLDPVRVISSGLACRLSLIDCPGEWIEVFGRHYSTVGGPDRVIVVPEQARWDVRIVNRDGPSSNVRSRNRCCYLMPQFGADHALHVRTDVGHSKPQFVSAAAAVGPATERAPPGRSTATMTLPQEERSVRRRYPSGTWSKSSTLCISGRIRPALYRSKT